jgi:hypothetical protein
VGLPETLRVAFPTDQHVPYEDKEAVELAMKIICDFDPDELIVGSDGQDFYAISKYDKNPERMSETKLQYEIDRWQDNQKDWISAAPRALRRYLVGNHEDRLQRYLWRHPEMASLNALKLENLLQFDRMRLPGKPELEIVYFDNLMIRHGSVIRKGSAYTARAELEIQKYSINTASGHSHRGGTHYATTYRGPVVAYECFCLCDLHPEYAHHLMDWQQGTVLFTVGPNFLSAEPVPFIRRYGKLEAAWRGQLYRA